jgi:hypothetical protein
LGNSAGEAEEVVVEEVVEAEAEVVVAEAAVR